MCTMDDAMAAHYLERLCERVVAQACVDYNNAKTEAELRDESALAADLARYVAFKGDPTRRRRSPRISIRSGAPRRRGGVRCCVLVVQCNFTPS